MALRRRGEERLLSLASQAEAWPLQTSPRVRDDDNLKMTIWGRQSVGLCAAGWGHYSVHPQILDHLTVMIVGMGDAKCGQAQAGRFAVPRVLQHVFRSQGGRGLVTEGKRILQELDDVGFGFQVLRTVPVL